LSARFQFLASVPRGFAGAFRLFRQATPWVMVTGSLAYSESGVLLGLALAMAAITLRSRWAGGVAFGLGVGVMIGSKASSLMLAVPAAFAWALVMGRSRIDPRWWLAWIGAASVALFPWLLRNAWFTAAPVFPLLCTELGLGWWKPVQAARWELARQFTREHKVTLVLKGAGTVVTDVTGPPRSERGKPGWETFGLILAAMFLVACGPKYPNCDSDENCKEKGEFCVDKLCRQCAERCSSQTQNQRLFDPFAIFFFHLVIDFQLEQVQDFTPTPMTLSTLMYYTGFDPYTGKKVYVARSIDEKKRQKEFFFWYKKDQKLNGSGKKLFKGTTARPYKGDKGISRPKSSPPGRGYRGGFGFDTNINFTALGCKLKSI
jgi:hypothetical protein